MSHTVTQIHAPVAISDVQAVLASGGNSLSALCRHAGINRFSRFKPYGFGGAGPLTDAVRGGNNYGMTPVPVSLVRQGGNVSGSSPAWGQWSAPGTGAWKRLGDFTGYSHDAGRWLTAARIYTNNPDDDKVPMGGIAGNANVHGKIYADVTIADADPAYTLGMGLFRHALPDLHTVTGPTDFSQWCITLIWGAYEGGELMAGAWWWAQLPPLRFLPAGEHRLVLAVSPERQQAVEDAEGLCNVGILCLAPPAGASGLELSDARMLVSLNMWDDAEIEDDTVFASKTIASWTPPPVVHDYRVYGDFTAGLSVPETAVGAGKFDFVFAPLEADVQRDDDMLYLRLSSASFFLGMEFTRAGFTTRGIVPVTADVAVRLSDLNRRISIFGDDTPFSVPLSVVRRYMNNGLPSGTYTLRLEPILTADGVAYDVEEPFTVKLVGTDDAKQDSWAEENIDVGDGIYGEWTDCGSVVI